MRSCEETKTVLLPELLFHAARTVQGQVVASLHDSECDLHDLHAVRCVPGISGRTNESGRMRVFREVVVTACCLVNGFALGVLVAIPEPITPKTAVIEFQGSSVHQNAHRLALGHPGRGVRRFKRSIRPVRLPERPVVRV